MDVGINGEVVEVSRRWDSIPLCLRFSSTETSQTTREQEGHSALIVLIFSCLTFQTYPMYQRQAGDTSNDSRRWQSKEICNVSESTCGNERHFYAFLRLRPGIQRGYITIGAEWINAMRSVGCDRSKVPLIVSVRRVVAEKWPEQNAHVSRMTLETSIWPPQTT